MSARPPRRSFRGVESRYRSDYKLPRTFVRSYATLIAALQSVTCRPLNTQYIMATTVVSANGTFDMNQTVRRSQAAVIRQVNNMRFDRFEVHNNLVGGWPGADPTHFYCGLVPVIGGVARFDLTLLSFDLQSEQLATYPNGADGEVVWQTLTDALHTYAVQTAANAPTYQQWLEGIRAHFPNGGTLVAIEYVARTRRGGVWRNAILGANL